METTFYSDFSDFPYPFASIKLEDFDRRIMYGFNQRKNIKILGKYHIYNEIHLIWLLKEIHVLLGNIDLAKSFSELGMKFVLEHANEMAKSNHNKIDEHYIIMKRQQFQII